MQCRRCGKELGASARCSFCGYQNAEEVNVREMSALERNNYDGLTIEVHTRDYQGQQNHQHFQRSARNSSRDGFWTQLFGNHIITRILVALVLVMLIAFTVFVALPLAMTVVGALVFYYLVRRVIFRR